MLTDSLIKTQAESLIKSFIGPEDEPAVDNLLLEDGDDLLLEDGNKIKLE